MLDFGFYNEDCMKGMVDFPDKYFDLAIVDPPYGGGFTEGGGCQGWFSKYHQNEERFFGGRHFTKAIKEKIINWDVAPGQEYFDELFRISKNQVIWGGNYFRLPPTRCFLVWRKLSIGEDFSMAMAEYAWTSFDSNAKVFEYPPQGRSGERFHPTQKPVELYKWILNRFSKPGDIILDTHVGSASSLIACRETGHKYVGFEIDEQYYKLAKERLEAAEAQANIFDFGL